MAIKIVQPVYPIFCPALGPSNSPSRWWRGLTGYNQNSFSISNQFLSDAPECLSQVISAWTLLRHFLFTLDLGDITC